MATIEVGESVRTTCPRDCYDACGVLVERRADRLVVRGDPARLRRFADPQAHSQPGRTMY